MGRVLLYVGLVAKCGWVVLVVGAGVGVIRRIGGAACGVGDMALSYECGVSHRRALPLPKAER
jgi:hypothetical protein